MNKIKVGQILNNQELMGTFKCGISGGMRRSKKTNSLILVCDHTRSIYQDKWKDGILNYTGMGLVGNQNLDFKQNKTLAESNTNRIEVHLFEVYNSKKYTYKGKVYLAGEPFQEYQNDENGESRKVWMFPLKLRA